MRNILLPLALIGGLATAAGAQTTTAPTTPPASTPTPAMTAPAGHGHHGSPLMAADTNHDGTVTKAEMLAAASARAAKMSANQPAGDAASGKKAMTPEAAQARASAMFDRMDTNHDGKLDSTEIAAREGMMKKAAGKKRGGGDMSGADSSGE